jgi:diguanylate cyclase (GGDEF)-like protein
MIEMDLLSQVGAGTYCLAIADLDGFKDLNDTYGHSCGDVVLARIGATFRTNVRTTDLVGRWGGEEFIFVLPQAALVDGEALSERIRSAVENLVIHCTGHSHRITVSVGVADGDPTIPGFRVLKRADDAMYDAKRAGRNCVRTRSRDATHAPEHPDRASARSVRVHGNTRLADDRRKRLSKNERGPR